MGARAWALLSMIVGCLLVVVAMAGAKSEAIYLMDRVVRVDTAGPYGNSLDGASRVLTTMSLVHMLLFMGLIVFFISLLGITATQGRHKCTAAVYGVSSASCAAVILMMSMQILQRVQVTQPIMDRQVQHLCNASTYIQLGAAQHCFWASKYGAAPPCEAACSWKVTVLQNGCKVMPQLCESFQYQADSEKQTWTQTETPQVTWIKQYQTNIKPYQTNRNAKRQKNNTQTSGLGGLPLKPGSGELHQRFSWPLL